MYSPRKLSKITFATLEDSTLEIVCIGSYLSGGSFSNTRNEPIDTLLKNDTEIKKYFKNHGHLLSNEITFDQMYKNQQDKK